MNNPPEAQLAVSREATSGRDALPGHIPALDGLRGLAVLLVLCYDCLKIPAGGGLIVLLSRKMAAFGWIGVDLFFVLSGFLITGILLDTVGKRGYWKSFILRRALRIFPLYYATLLLVFVVLPALATAMRWGELNEWLAAARADQLWYWMYAQNWLFAWRGLWPEERVLNHFWSLAVEEQFYLVWPLLLCCCRGKRLVAICLGLCGLALGLRCVLLLQGQPPVTPFVMTITRMDSLCAGALLALGVRSAFWRRQGVRWAPWCFPGALLLVFGLDAAFPILKSESLAAGSLGHTLIALLFVSLIAALLAIPDRHPLSRLFCGRVLILCGKYSYAIYVFHRAMYYCVRELNWESVPETLRPWAIFMATLGASLVAAHISWLLLEGPCLSLKKYVPRPDAEGEPPRVEPPLNPEHQHSGELGTRLPYPSIVTTRPSPGKPRQEAPQRV